MEKLQPIDTAKINYRTNPWTDYSDHNFETNLLLVKTTLNESTRQPINDAAKLLLKHTNIETDSNSDDRSILDKRCS